MKTFNDKSPENYVYIDVDGTLLLWDKKQGRVPRGVLIEDLRKFCTINYTVVEYIERKFSEGSIICIWSKGGRFHSKMAASREFCDIEKYVSFYLQKPSVIVDDSWKSGIVNSRCVEIFDQKLKKVGV